MMINQNQLSGANASQNPREGVKSLFSCLGGENSQSMNSINDNEASTSQAQAPNVPSVPQQRSTGAIPKIKSKQNNKVSPKPPAPLNTPSPPTMPKANFSKSSLQYLLMNKWLPLGPDYKIIDFNFMFSRNCSSNGQCNEIGGHEGVVQFNGQAEMLEPGIYQAPVREYPMMNNGQYPRVIRNVQQLSRLHESEIEREQHENAYQRNAFRARSESPSFGQVQQDDSLRNWSFNFQNNSFKPSPVQQQIVDVRKDNPVEEQDQSKSNSPSNSENSSSSTSSSSGNGKMGEMKKSENYENLASLQHDPCPSSSAENAQNDSLHVVVKKKKSTESQSSSDSVTIAEDEEDNEDPFDLESDID
jgi:hypothetical protein